MRFREVYLSLGSNLGNRANNLQQALAGLEQKGHSIIQRSPVYETEPQDVASQPWFLNMVVEIETHSSPLELLKTLQGIERGMGRARAAELKRGPRIIDIDILLFGTAKVDTPDLAIPHPRMWDRRFVLQPLRDIAPALRAPGTELTLEELVSQLEGQLLRRA